MGCEDNEKNSSILLKPGKTHTFPQKIDLYAGIPKVLSIRISLESNQGYVNTMNDHQNIVFLTNCENPHVIELEDKYCHNPGVFNYIRVTFTDVFKKSFYVNNRNIYISIIIENDE